LSDSESQALILEAGDPHPIDSRSIFRLAWPVILTNLLTTAVQWVDLLMVARLGKQTVAAVGLASFLITLLWAVMMALQTGTQIMVAQAYGAGERRVIDRTVQLAIVLGGIFALALSAFFYGPGKQSLVTAFLAFDVEPEVARIGTIYLSITLIMLSGMVISLVGQAALRAVGDTRTPLWLTGAANLLNIVFNYALIFGKFGMPELGVAGAAWGTVLARGIEAVLYLVLLYSGRLAIELRMSRFAFDWQVLKRLAALGSPAALEQMVFSVGQLIYQAVIASYGTNALAAYQIGVILLQAAFMPGLGISVAATTLVGQWVGAGDDGQAQLAGTRCRHLALILMSVMGVVFFFAAGPFARLVIDDPGVVALAVLFIRTLAVAQPFMAIHFAMAGALRGAGAVKAPLLGAVFGMYLGRLPISAAAAFVFGWPIHFAFVGMMLDHITRAGYLHGRWRKRVSSHLAS
jgi:putative MATE family efflux protein